LAPAPVMTTWMPLLNTRPPGYSARTLAPLAALFEVGLILFVITVLVNALARLLIWRVARGAAVGSKAL